MQRDADKMIKVAQTCAPNLLQCGTPPPNAFRVLSREDSSRRPAYHDIGIITSDKVLFYWKYGTYFHNYFLLLL